MTTQLFFGPPGASPDEMIPLKHVSVDGFGAADAFAEATESFTRLGEIATSWTLAFETVMTSPGVMRLLFGRTPKRIRKRREQARKQARKRARDQYRDAQRRALGMTNGEKK